MQACNKNLSIGVVVSHILDVPPQARYAHRSHLDAFPCLSYPIRMLACLKVLGILRVLKQFCVVSIRTQDGSLVALPLNQTEYVPENCHRS